MHDAVNLLFGNGGNYIVTKSRNLSTPLKSQHCQYKVSLVLAHDIICFVTYHVNLTIKVFVSMSSVRMICKIGKIDLFIDQLIESQKTTKSC